MADFTAAEVETGGRASTSIVYSKIADAIVADGYLDLRGFTSMKDGGDETLQKRAMLLATDAIEEAARPRFKGKLNDTQALLFPADGAYDSQGVILPDAAVPVDFLEAWLVAADKQHAGTLATVNPLAMVFEEMKQDQPSGNMDVKFREQQPAHGIWIDPDVGPLLLRVLPP